MKYVRTGMTKGKSTERRKYHPAYKSWQNMIQRCTNPNYHNFHRYGGRGIKVCKRWLESSAKFLEDMMPSWFEGATIDRIDINGNYTPKNCRWVSKQENIAISSRSIMVELDGVRMTVMQASKNACVHYMTVLRRVRSGWPIEAAISTPSLKEK